MPAKKYNYLFCSVILVLFIFTVSKMDFNVFQYLANFNFSTILTLVFLQILTIVIISHQWYSLIKIFNPHVGYLKVIELNVIGTLTESITPAVKSGGEGVKLFLLNRDFSLEYNEGLSVIIVQKTVSSLVFLLYFFIALSKNRFNLNIQPLNYLYFTLVIMALFLIYYFFAPMKIKRKVSTFAKKVAADLLGFKEKKILLGYLTFNNLIVWLGYPIKFFIVSRAFNVDLSFITLSAIIFITYGVSMLPTTPGSIGTYEGTMTLLLRIIGVPTQKALAIAIVTRFFTFWLVVILSGLYLGSLNVLNKLNNKAYKKTPNCE